MRRGPWGPGQGGADVSPHGGEESRAGRNRHVGFGLLVPREAAVLAGGAVLWAPAVPCVLVALVTGLPEDTNDHLHLGDGKPRLSLVTNQQVVELGLEVTTCGTRKRGHSVTVTVGAPLPGTAGPLGRSLASVCPPCWAEELEPPLSRAPRVALRGRQGPPRSNLMLSPGVTGGDGGQEAAHRAWCVCCRGAVWPQTLSPIFASRNRVGEPPAPSAQPVPPSPHSVHGAQLGTGNGPFLHSFPECAVRGGSDCPLLSPGLLTMASA